MGNPYGAKRKNIVRIPVIGPSTPVVDEVAEESSTVSEVPETYPLGVGDLTVAEAKALVGDDKELAAAALAEEVAGDNRKTLVTELEKIVNG